MQFAYTNEVFSMSTTHRHNQITGTLYGRLLTQLEKNLLSAFHEECSLVYWGKRGRGTVELVEPLNLENRELFSDSIINDLEYVQPDFMLFKNNTFATNNKKTRIAGKPDLIVEVWSEHNSDVEKQWKLELYSTSSVTEHWYIEQHSNKVLCFYGQKQLKDQSLKEVLTTKSGIEFDLKYLAL